LRCLLTRDGCCDSCKRWNHAHEHETLELCKFQQPYRTKPGGPGGASLYTKLHCYACQTCHNICQSSSTWQHAAGYQTDRQCLGQQGTVQLCEHVLITWASIKAHIDDWRKQQRWSGPLDWKACIDSFSIECHDPAMTRAAPP
jgi:hypothetical protein